MPGRNDNRRFVKASIGIQKVPIRDPQEQIKRERQRQLRPQLHSALQRAHIAGDSLSIREKLRALVSDGVHPWWRHLPADQQTGTKRWQLIRRRIQAWLRRKPQRIGLTVASYLIISSLPLFWMLPLISVVALLPLLIVPPVGVLVYWLVWQEFHL